MPYFLLALLAITSLTTLAQTHQYRAATLPDQSQLIVRVGDDGKHEPVGRLPSDRPSGRNAGRVLLPYAPETKWTLNFNQFGTGKVYNPGYRFSIDFNPAQAPAVRKAYGINMHSVWATSPEEQKQLRFGEGFFYLTESALHGSFEGAGFFEHTLAEYENQINTSVPAIGYDDYAFVNYMVFNIEQSNEIMPGNSSKPIPGFRYGSYGQGKFGENWDTVQHKKLLMESTGETITMGELAGRGSAAWELEMNTRRANRLVVLMQNARNKARPGSKIAYGSSMFQGNPKLAQHYKTTVFNDGTANGAHLGQNARKQIKLNGRTYVMTGDQYTWEQFHLDYYYDFTFTMANRDYQDIWVKQLPETQRYSYIWGKIKPWHVGAAEKGHWQENRYRMKHRPGQRVRPMIRMIELVYEADRAGYVDGLDKPDAEGGSIKRIPDGMGLSEAIQYYENGQLVFHDTPKIWLPPWSVRSKIMWSRFLEGNGGGGFHVFNAVGAPSNGRMADLSKLPQYNHELHTIPAMIQARADLQPYEDFFGRSTLVEDPEVQVGGKGAFLTYDGTTAFADNDTTRQKPACSIRYARTKGGWRALVIIQMNQGFGQERIDVVRVPGGLLNGNRFRVKTRGPGAHVYEFLVKRTDVRQTYEALPPAQPDWERAGYGGRVGR
ncbi:hypothetical protein [Spirosoma rigui]|uniref:hypothetical protein n=1 Tax=Spirosoma rigui TaxID=564064 RepID=UPI0009B0D563|nr:hypothetical protein [Spirosoma rigui]